jgi:hypothetical protein
MLESLPKSYWQQLRISSAEFIAKAKMVAVWKKISASEVVEVFNLAKVFLDADLKNTSDIEFRLWAKNKLSEFIIRIMIAGFERQPRKLQKPMSEFCVYQPNYNTRVN